MSAAILTLNIGDYICDNVRSSHLHAARHWGVDYIEVTSIALPPGYYPSYGKPEVMRNRLAGYDRVLFLDGDMLIRADAPNPFTLYPIAYKWYAVNDHQSHYASTDPEFGKGVLRDVINAKIAMNEQRLGCTYGGDSSRFFNAGMWLCSPRYHRAVFDYFIANIPPEPNWDGHLEQALLNIAVDQTCRESLVIIPETWNRINPPRGVPMEHFIHHFTGNHREELRELMKAYPWDTT